MSEYPQIPSDPTQNTRVDSLTRVLTPVELKNERKKSEVAQQTVLEARAGIERILAGEDKRVLVIVGPCSIHDEKAALEYAGRLNEIRKQYEDRIMFVMRVYFEKPRTTTGWKGLIYDPHLDDSFDIEHGLRAARGLLLEINDIGLATATEFLDPIVPQYIDGLISWAAIGARTTESQTHRQLASGLSMPVGYKNATDGNLQVAINAMIAARGHSSFLGITPGGQVAIVKTAGNPAGHLILRGGADGTNFDAASIAHAENELQQAGLSPRLMVDCSHANAGKSHEQQQHVWRSVMEQRVKGNRNIIGMMLESNLVEGRQNLGTHKSALVYGQSITDECVGWEKTVELLGELYDALK